MSSEVQVSNRVATFGIERLTGALGAVVVDLDLTGALDDTTIDAVRDALHEHQVLFFHDQDLSDEQQLAFAARFGEVSVFPLTRLVRR